MLMRRADAQLKEKREQALLLAKKASLHINSSETQQYRPCEIASTGFTFRDTLRRRLVDLLQKARLEIMSAS